MIRSKFSSLAVILTAAVALSCSDFTITFPVSALTGATNFTITSDASGYVSYDMKPHGIIFARPVIVTQRLRNTEVYGTPLGTEVFGANLADWSVSEAR